MNVAKELFGTTPRGEEVYLYTCTNSSGLALSLTNYGARITALTVPDRNGTPGNVTLGFDTLDKYFAHTAYFGCMVGRFANRIARGRFTLDGVEYRLATNDGPNHLHGGVRGFDKAVWQAIEIRTDDRVGVRFTYRSPDGEEGYPGNLDATVSYTWSNHNELRIDFGATADRKTIVNLTNHAYWNLAGDDAGSILDHEVMLACDRYLPVDDTAIPIGQLAEVEGNVMDFRKPQRIGQHIDEVQIGDGPRGYDHCYVVRQQNGLSLAARVKDPHSGRVMEVHTTQPGIQFYTGNFLDGNPVNGGHHQHSAFCLETQHFPDSPNHPPFPSSALEPNGRYEHTTIHRFLVD